MVVHRINDFARPRYPFPLRALNLALTPFTGKETIDENRLLNAAMQKTDLSDFGDDQFREPLHILVKSLQEEAALTAFAYKNVQQMLTQFLMTRLLVEHLLKLHPEILDIPVSSPIIILGLPRTGTTHLHNLISRDPRLRWLPYWESHEPLLLPGKKAAPGKPDPRIKRAAGTLRLLEYALPLFPLMHEMAAELPDEEIYLFAPEFSSMIFETLGYVPSYRDWYRKHDQTPTYRYVRKMLQVLQWSRGGTQWVLKSPQHLEHLGPLLTVFPDAKIIQTHRDPVAVTVSFCTMISYAARLLATSVEPIKRGQYWSDRVEGWLNASMQARPLVPEGQVFDMHFHEFMQDNMAMVERIYEFMELPLTPEARNAIEAFITANPRGKHGRIEYRLEDFGLDLEERRQAFRFYQDYFNIPSEL